MWAAREQDGTLWLYDEKPTLCDGVFAGPKYNRFSFRIPHSDVLPEVTFENSPVKLKAVIRKTEGVTARVKDTGEIIRIEMVSIDVPDPALSVIENIETGERLLLSDVVVL